MKPRTVRRLTAACALTLLCTLAWAQVDAVVPPKASGEPEPPVLRTWLAVVIAGGAVVAASLIPAKRGHQD